MEDDQSVSINEANCDRVDHEFRNTIQARESGKLEGRRDLIAVSPEQEEEEEEKLVGSG